MPEHKHQAAIFELPANRDALDIMLDTMHVAAHGRELVADALFAVLALTLDAVRVFRAADVQEVLGILGMLCAEAAPGLLHVWMRASPGVEERILVHMSSFPNQMTSTRVQ